MGWCKHKWKIIKTIEVVDQNGNLYYYKYVLQCENCGKIKGKKV